MVASSNRGDLLIGSVSPSGVDVLRKIYKHGNSGSGVRSLGFLAAKVYEVYTAQKGQVRYVKEIVSELEVKGFVQKARGVHKGSSVLYYSLTPAGIAFLGSCFGGSGEPLGSVDYADFDDRFAGGSMYESGGDLTYKSFGGCDGYEGGVYVSIGGGEFCVGYVNDSRVMLPSPLAIYAEVGGIDSVKDMKQNVFDHSFAQLLTNVLGIDYDTAVQLAGNVRSGHDGMMGILAVDFRHRVDTLESFRKIVRGLFSGVNISPSWSDFEEITVTPNTKAYRSCLRAIKESFGIKGKNGSKVKRHKHPNR